MSIDGQQDIEGWKRIGAIVAEARDAMGAQVSPGVTTAELDSIGKEILERHGARSAPRLAVGYIIIAAADESSQFRPLHPRRRYPGSRRRTSL